MGYRNAVIEIAIFSSVMIIPMIVMGIMASWGVNYHIDKTMDRINSTSLRRLDLDNYENNKYKLELNELSMINKENKIDNIINKEKESKRQLKITMTKEQFIYLIRDNIYDGKTSNRIGFFFLLIDFFIRLLEIYLMFNLKHNVRLISGMKAAAVGSVICNLVYLILFSSSMTYFRDVEIQDQNREDKLINSIFLASIKTGRYDLTLITFSIITGIMAIIMIILVCFCRIRDRRKKRISNKISVISSTQPNFSEKPNKNATPSG